MVLHQSMSKKDRLESKKACIVALLISQDSSTLFTEEYRTRRHCLTCDMCVQRKRATSKTQHKPLSRSKATTLAYLLLPPFVKGLKKIQVSQTTAPVLTLMGIF